MRWFWSLYGMFGVPAELRSDGQAATLDEAKAQFETAWRRWLAGAQLTASTPRPPPDRRQSNHSRRRISASEFLRRG